ncbi:hypothetical protein GCM10027217_30560 [Pseudomaricurvus hydrocarbonicus]
MIFTDELDWAVIPEHSPDGEEHSFSLRPPPVVVVSATGNAMSDTCNRLFAAGDVLRHRDVVQFLCFGYASENTFTE